MSFEKIIQIPKLRKDGIWYFTERQFKQRRNLDLIPIGKEGKNIVFVTTPIYRNQNLNKGRGT